MATRIAPTVPRPSRRGRVVAPAGVLCPSASFVVASPLPKPRAKVTRFGNFLPKEYTDYCERVRDEASVVFAEFADRGEPWNAEAGAYSIGCRFYVERTTSGDIDNLLGGVLDALNKFAWPDDRIVTDVFRLSKRIDKANPRVEVEIRVGGDEAGDEDEADAARGAA